jgi:hypothetical protein
MLEILLISLLSSFFLICSGHILNLKDKTISGFEFYSKQIIYGLIFISFIALVLNFFTPLSKLTNSLVFIIILIISLINKKIRKSITNKSMLSVIIVISSISFLLLYKSKIYQPDAGMYHLPYTGLINSEKINIGIANIHHRFGFVTIIQYTSAIFNNYLFLENGITLPLAILASAVIINFYSHIIIYFKEKKISNIHFIYLLCVIIFMSIKMSDYSNYGNDAPGHFIFFFLISEILKEKFIEIDLNKLLILSVFIFLNKISFILILIIPLTWIFLYKKININIVTIISFFFLLLWLVKNILISGCIIYPLEDTCSAKLKWSTNNNQTINTKEAYIEIESWSKGYPDQKKYTQEKFIEKFNWLKTWSNKHFLYILNKLFPLICILIFIYLFLRKNNKASNKLKYPTQKLYFIFFFSFVSLLLWFLKAPLYRFGYSSIILFITVIYIQIIKNYFFCTKKNIKFFKIIFLSTFVFLIVKQLPRLVNVEENLLNKGWPNIYTENKYKEFNLGNVLIYNSINCGYTKILCTYYADLENKIEVTEVFNYRIISNIPLK